MLYITTLQISKGDIFSNVIKKVDNYDSGQYSLGYFKLANSTNRP